MKLFFSKSAVQDLIRIKEFIAKDNLEAAEKIAMRIQQIIGKLVTLPHIGKLVEGLESSWSDKQVRELMVGDYVVRYISQKDIIYIARIWHGKEYRDYE